jgi:hypothetical protein
MIIQTAYGKFARVVSIKDTHGTQPTYNLEVADFHTYFVGEDRLWVHNECPESGNDWFKKRGKKGKSPKVKCKNKNCGALHGGSNKAATGKEKIAVTIVQTAGAGGLSGLNFRRFGNENDMREPMKRSYKLHTNNEWKLMREGVKPMAYFMHPPIEEEFFWENFGKKFLALENDGKVSRFFKELSDGDEKLHMYCYTASGEGWRANALFLLYESFFSCVIDKRWNEAMERMLGTLLGYNNAQNDEHVNIVRERFEINI